MGVTLGGPHRGSSIRDGLSSMGRISFSGEGAPWCTIMSQRTGKFDANETGVRRENPAMPVDEMGRRSCEENISQHA